MSLVRLVATVASALGFGACGGDGGDGATPPTQSAQLPTALYSVAVAYDEARGRLVVFGGSNNGAQSGDTW